MEKTVQIHTDYDQKIRILATDLDGTLLTSSKTVTSYTRDVLISAQQKGLTLILASGRPLYSILPFAQQLKMQKYSGYIIAYNGSLVYDCAASRVLKKKTISPSLVSELAAAVPREHFRLHGYKDNTIVVRDTPNKWSTYIANANKMSLLETEDFLNVVTDPQHKCLVTGSPRKLWHLERRINRHFSSVLVAYRSESFLLEIVPKGVNKATELKDLLERLDCSEESLLCCGDGYNDIDMMRLAGISCATRNAKRPVKQVASYVTESNDRDGVALALERFCSLT